MNYDLTDNQQAIFDFLKERSDSGVPPTVREICQAVGLRSTSSVQANLLALEEKGYIMRDPMHKRSIRIVGQSENVRHVPLLGVVTAGLPILATEQIECYIPFPKREGNKTSCYLLSSAFNALISLSTHSGEGPPLTVLLLTHSSRSIAL